MFYFKMIREIMWVFDGQKWKTIIVFRKKKQDKTIKFYQDCNNNMPENLDTMHDRVFLRDSMNSDEMHAAWFTAVRGGLLKDLETLASRGCNPFVMCGHQTARTMVKNWTTRLGRLDSIESSRMKLFKDMHDVLYKAEMNWLNHKKLKRTLSKWRKE